MPSVESNWVTNSQELLVRLGVTSAVALQYATALDEARQHNKARKGSAEYKRARVLGKTRLKLWKNGGNDGGAHGYADAAELEDTLTSDAASQLACRKVVRPAKATRRAAAIAGECAACGKNYKVLGALRKHEATCKGPATQKRKASKAGPPAKQPRADADDKENNSSAANTLDGLRGERMDVDGGASESESEEEEEEEEEEDEDEDEDDEDDDEEDDDEEDDEDAEDLIDADDDHLEVELID